MNFDMGLVSPPLKVILGRYFRTAQLPLLAVLATTIVAAVASTSAPYLFSRLIDQIASASAGTELILAFLVYAVLIGVAYASQRMARFLTFLTSESLNFVTSTSFFSRLVNKTSAFFIDHNPAEIESAQQKGAAALNIAVQFALGAVLPGVAQIALALLLLGAVLDLDIAIIVFVYGTLHVFLVAHTAKVSRPYLDKAIEMSLENSRFVGNAVTSMDTLRQYRSDSWLIGQFQNRQNIVLRAFNQYGLKHISYAAVFGLALMVQFGISLAILLPRVDAGVLTLGDLVLFNTLLLQLNLPLQMLGDAIQQFVQSYSSFAPFARMWHAEVHEEPDRNLSFEISDGNIEFRDVSYIYPNGRGMFCANFVAVRGRMTFVTGASGSGKTTLFKLLLKSMRPASGSIVIDGVELNNISRDEWFSHIAAVPQEILLLNDTLANNIVLGRELDMNRLQRAAEQAAIFDLVEKLDAGFETIVGERGMKLSGGERQRIAIARALYGEPRIILLDEASAALDVKTEKAIMDRLRLLQEEITIVAITHRLSVLTSIDNVVRIGSDAPLDDDN